MHAPWLEHYDPKVPKSIGTYPEKTLVDFVAERAPDKTALVFKGRKVSYGEIDRESDALAHSLKAMGVKQGDRVALVLPNSPQFVIAELAVWKLGAMIAPQSLLYTDRELQESLSASAPETVIVLTPFYERMKNIQSQTSIKRVIATNVKEYLPGVLRVLFTLVKEKKEGHRITLRKGDLWLQSLIREGASRGKIARATTPDQAAVVLMSGGTTGTP
jgi:long-chain acyl-CoA synthetase